MFIISKNNLDNSRLFHGGTYGSCTRLRGFADRCVTAPPTRHYQSIIANKIEVIPTITKVKSRPADDFLLWCTEEDLNLHGRNGH